MGFLHNYKTSRNLLELSFEAPLYYCITTTDITITLCTAQSWLLIHSSRTAAAAAPFDHSPGPRASSLHGD